jgi:catechol 2,3-dioxygenase-like lactoylglutathione lyase family enzyme
MQSTLSKMIVDQFERGQLSRRQLVARLMGLGAAMATLKGAAWAQEPAGEAGQGTGEQGSRPTFQATGLDHVALDVTDVARSREFYQRHLGLRVIRGTGSDSSFLGADRDFFLALFRAEQPKLNHYCYAIENYDPQVAVQRLEAAGIRPRRTGGRVYFPDPDGITVQIAGQ